MFYIQLKAQPVKFIFGWMPLLSGTQSIREFVAVESGQLDDFGRIGLLQRIEETSGAGGL